MIKNYSREIECHAIIKNNLENNQSKTQENLKKQQPEQETFQSKQKEKF
ncbi:MULTISPECIES: hypothetical protein [unclassified Spiroplasma]